MTFVGVYITIVWRRPTKSRNGADGRMRQPVRTRAVRVAYPSLLVRSFLSCDT